MFTRDITFVVYHRGVSLPDDSSLQEEYDISMRHFPRIRVGGGLKTCFAAFVPPTSLRFSSRASVFLRNRRSRSAKQIEKRRKRHDADCTRGGVEAPPGPPAWSSLPRSFGADK